MIPSSAHSDPIQDIIERGAPANISRRHLANRLFKYFCIFITSFAIIALTTLIVSILIRGASSLSWNFLTGETSSYAESASVKVSLWGSIWVCVICALIALPIGVATAVYLEEFSRKNRLTNFIRINISNLAGVPSIVYGLLGLTLFVRMFGLAGSPADPALEFGGSTYAIFYDEIGEPIRIPVEHRQDTPVLADGMEGFYEQSRELPDGTLEFTGEWLPVKISVASNALSDDPTVGTFSSAIAQAPPDHFEVVKPWYYIQFPFGQSVLAGGLTLMMVVLPVVIIASQEALRAVPPSLRDGSLAMGASTWQTTWKITLPAATPTIMTGSILAMSRAIGEAAPILVLGVALMITEVPSNLMDLFTVLPLQIYNWTSRPQPEFRDLAAGGIIVLLGVLLVFNTIAVIIRQKMQQDLQ